MRVMIHTVPSLSLRRLPTLTGTPAPAKVPTMTGSRQLSTGMRTILPNARHLMALRAQRLQTRSRLRLRSTGTQSSTATTRQTQAQS